MKEVSKEEYQNFIKDKNVDYSATGDWPFTGIWKDKGGNVVAKTIPVGKHLGINSDKYKYLIAASA